MLVDVYESSFQKGEAKDQEFKVTLGYMVSEFMASLRSIILHYK